MTWYYTSGQQHYILFSSALVVQCLSSGWPWRMGEYRNTVYIEQEPRKEEKYLKFLFLIQPFQRPTYKRAAMVESLSGSLGWDALALTLLSSLTQQHSSWQQGGIYATAFQLQADVAASSKHRLPSQHSLLFTLQMGFSPPPHQKCKESQNVYKTGYQTGENVQVFMKWYRCYHISPVSSWHELMCLPVPFSVT